MHEPDRIERRTFVAAAAAAAGGLLTTHASGGPSTAPRDAGTTAIDFSRSFLHCAPKGSNIWVRVQLECFCELKDLSTGQSDAYALGVVAKTGLGKNPKTGETAPGYDYWLIFSRDTVYTRRTHASVYGRNPTTLASKEFGPIGWHLHPAPAAPLTSAEEVRRALESWRRITARTELRSVDGARSFTVEYPVKWADAGTAERSYRVETGPVVLLDPDRLRVGEPRRLDDFQWAHLDYHTSEHVRLLLDRPTELLSEAASFPPNEHGRQDRPNPGLSSEQVEAIRARLFDGWSPPVPPAQFRELFQTDHCSAASERTATNRLFAIE